ncbi:MAG: YeiH family putative sulfate export transporter [Oceanospirillaceae bacterium]|nr:YeiH family putative sulfate export transporter [Oceanospirillaceae bacterium]
MQNLLTLIADRPGIRAKGIPGVALCLLLAAAALNLSQLPVPGFSILGPLTLAMLIGLGIGQWLPETIRSHTQSGTSFARQRLLRLGIVLYGLRIGIDDLIQIGPSALVTDLLVVTCTFALAAWMGVRLLKMELRSALLVGAGSAVCGAAAILATAPALRAREQDIPVAIGTVVLFGTCAMLLYPWLWTLSPVQSLFNGSEMDFGRYMGATIHEVAQVAAAAGGLQPAAGEAAVLTKLVRVMLLVPVIFVIGSIFAKRDGGCQEEPIRPPWFALVFLLMPFVSASGLFNADQLKLIAQVDTIILCMAMAALGLETRFSVLKKAGWAPLLLGALLFLFLLVGGLGFTLLI